MNEALAKLEALPEAEFQKFFAQLPERVKLLVRGGMCDWRETLPQWYEIYERNQSNPHKDEVHAPMLAS